MIKNSKAELLVFSENNFPYIVNNLEDIEIGKILNENQTVIMGATRQDNNKFYNSLLVIKKNNINFFDKKILVPFGEFIPFRDYFEFIEPIAGTVDFSTGDQERLLNINDKNTFIPVICYEIIFFWKILNKINNLSDVIINITNDSWFGNLIGPYQHFYLTKMRASELNKLILRVSDNGISGIINNKGSIVNFSYLNTTNIISEKIELNKNSNLLVFHKIYNFILIFSFIGFVAFSFIKNK